MYTDVEITELINAIQKLSNADKQVLCGIIEGYLLAHKSAD